MDGIVGWGLAGVLRTPWHGQHRRSRMTGDTLRGLSYLAQV